MSDRHYKRTHRSARQGREIDRGHSQLPFRCPASGNREQPDATKSLPLHGAGVVNPFNRSRLELARESRNGMAVACDLHNSIEPVKPRSATIKTWE